MADEKKNIFQQAIDALTNRDEKEAAQAASLAAQAKAETDARAKMAAQAKAEADAKAKAEAEAKARAQAALEAAERREQLETEQARGAAENAAKAARAALPRHVVGQDETLSGIALKKYGHATEPYWRLIYEANKEEIGDNPNRIRPGTELVIPILPAELKK